MLQLQPIELLFRVLPEGFLFILAIYAFSKKKIDVPRFIIASVICSVCAFGIRMLPISYGVHTILAMAVAMVLGATINKIEVVKSIRAILVSIILQFISEGINIFIIQNIFNVDMNEVFSNPVSKIIYGIPSLVILGVLIIGYYVFKNKRGELTSV